MNAEKSRKNLPMDVLRSFLAISEYGGFTQAGEVLGRSQAAISLQIKRLESSLGKPLFVRSGHTIALTQDGETLMDYARQILSLNDQALMNLQQKTVAGAVRLGIPSEFATALLPRILRRFSTENPGVTLEVNCDLSRNLLADVKRGKYDLVLGLHPSTAEAGRNLVKADRLVWVASRDFQVPGSGQDESLPIICAPEGCIYRSAALAGLDEKQIPWRVVYTIQDLSGIQSAIEEGLGATVLAESTVPRSLRVFGTSSQLPSLGKIGISLISGTKQPGEACRALRSHIQSALSETSPLLVSRPAS